jgi:putative flavoprotein involved in K+ transport
MFERSHDPKSHVLVEPGTAFMELRQREHAQPERLDVVVIGGGQAGLSVGYHLKQRGVRFAILDGSARVGDAWRKRWDSLKLFSPAWLDSLDGMPFPLPRNEFPTKDQMADYLESYAKHFELPVRSSTQVERLSRKDGLFTIETNHGELVAKQVVIAMASFQKQKVPAFASELKSEIAQLHSSEYKNAAQLLDGSVLVVGCGNSGAEIAHEVARSHKVFMTAKKNDEVPFDNRSFLGRWFLIGFLMRVVFHRVLTIRTKLGRKARPMMMTKATPLIRTRAADLARDGVERTGTRVTGVKDGLPVTDDGRTLDVSNIVWCTGFDSGQSWIDLPIFDGEGWPRHEAGVVTDAPGLYFVGLPFLYSMSSAMVHGVGRDAARISDVIAAQTQRDGAADTGELLHAHA